MKLSHSIAVVLAGAAAGFLFGRSGDVEATPNSEVAVTHSTKARSASSNEKAPPPRTLAGLVDGLRKSGGLPEGVADDVERLPNETLRERLIALAAMEIPGSLFLTPSEKWYAGLDALARELFHREGEASLIWAESTGDPDLSAALLRAAAEDPALVKKWMLKITLACDPDRQEGWRVLRRVADVAASRGSDSLLEAETLFPESLGDLPVGYPPDFDFAGYVAKTKSDKGRSSALKAWAIHDPEAVAALLVKTGNSGGFDIRESPASSAIEGFASVNDDATVVKWIEGWTSKLPEGVREDLLRNLVALRSRPDLAVAMVAGLASPQDRMAVAVGGLTYSWPQASIDPYHPALPNASERQSAVAAWWKNVRPDRREHSRTLMEKTLDQIDLPPAEKETLRAQMTDK